MATEYTPNYNLDLYAGTDKPNLRDQYNSAMGKIDAQFVNIENDHTETGNQISAINTNITQLGERITAAEESITTAEEKVTAVEGQIEQTNTELAAVKQTAENANSQANTNASAIEGINTELATVKQTAENAGSQANTNASAIESINTQLGTVQQGVSDLQSASRSLVLFDAKTTDEGIKLLGGPMLWGDDAGTMNAEIPDWANWLDFHFMSVGASYWKQGAGAVADTEFFTTPAICQTFPAKRAVKSDSGNAIVQQPITNFAILLPPTMGTVVDSGTGLQNISFGTIPFKINGKVITQNMGLDTTGIIGSFKNATGGAALVFKTNTPEYDNLQSTISLIKIVARA